MASEKITAMIEELKTRIHKLKSKDAMMNKNIINKLENGLDDEVLERGNNFSSGQRQLLSFARTIAHKPEVMILDEATANIDTETEQVIQNMLNGTFMAGQFIYNNQTYTYARVLLEAGRAKNVNPVHLAARILQEQGYGGSATACMDGGDGNYYYNYFLVHNFSLYGKMILFLKNL